MTARADNETQQASSTFEQVAAPTLSELWKRVQSQAQEIEELRSELCRQTKRATEQPGAPGKPRRLSRADLLVAAAAGAAGVTGATLL
jgi:hypothetical protein